MSKELFREIYEVWARSEGIPEPATCTEAYLLRLIEQMRDIAKQGMENKYTHYPTWICHNCGIKYGKRACGVATWHMDTCDVCGKETEVTEPRDFGHLKDGWQYRIAEPNLSRNVLIGVTNNDAPLAEQQLWLYVNKIVINDSTSGFTTLTTTPTFETIGKIRMEDV